MVTPKDRGIIRDLAARWQSLAADPVLPERKRLWKAVHDLKQERPVILIETSSIDGFVSPEGWHVDYSSFGVQVETKPATVAKEEIALGYTFNFPIQTPQDIKLLKKRTFSVDRQKTRQRQENLGEVMGDLLPVLVGNYDPFLADWGDEGFIGNFFFEPVHDRLVLIMKAIPNLRSVSVSGWSEVSPSGSGAKPRKRVLSIEEP